MKDLTQLRSEIDVLDRELTQLFFQRMALTHQVGEYKKAQGIPVLDAQREREVLAAKGNLVDDISKKEAITQLFETIMSISRRDQRTLVDEVGNDAYAKIQRDKKGCRQPLSNPRVFYQGEPGAYAHQAVTHFFGEDIQANRIPTWEELFEALRTGQGDYGVVPIENNSTGAINQIYDLLAQYDLFIVGEQMVQVNHCLAALKGTSLHQITTVYSHEQGLLQCKKFLKNYPQWKGVPRLNTAESARYVAQCNDRTQGAICSPMAANLYGLEILAHGINTNCENFTRFVVVSPVMERREGCDKISAMLVLPHRWGALHEVMGVFTANRLNMLKLESRPILNRGWEYRFFVDFTGDLEQSDMDGVLHELTQIAEGFQILGNYKNSTIDKGE